MSLFTDTLTGRVKITRFTANVVDRKVTVNPLPVDRQPDKSCRLVVKITDAAPAAGTITITGTTVEAFSFSDNGVAVGEKDFSTISSIAVAGISGGYVEIRAVSKTGQPINKEAVIYSSIPARFFPMKSSARRQVQMMPAGQQKGAQYILQVGPTRQLKENDLMYAISGIPGLTLGQVAFVEPILDLDGLTHHVEAEIAQP